MRTRNQDPEFEILMLRLNRILQVATQLRLTPLSRFRRQKLRWRHLYALALHKYSSPTTSLSGHKAPLKTDASNGIKSLKIQIIYFLLHHLHLNEYHAHIFFSFSYSCFGSWRIHNKIEPVDYSWSHVWAITYLVMGKLCLLWSVTG